MANVGEKRPPSEQDPDDLEPETLPSAPKRPAPSFNFRPSPLQQATHGFSLKQSILPSAAAEPCKDSDATKPVVTSLQGGFLKLDSDELKPISVSLGAPSPSNAFRNVAVESQAGSNAGTPNQVNHSAEGTGNNNLFLQFTARTGSFSATSLSSSSSTSAMSTRSNEGTPTNAVAAEANESSSQREEDQLEPSPAQQAVLRTNGDDIAGGDGVPFAFQGATAILPEVHPVTGEEKEKKIVQIPARLYSFDVTTHTWKERGRGEARLNDAAQSGGLFQSRLVMRTAGSYRVLLNTHLWAQMKCERANQKSIRITAQHGDHGEVAVFLIMGATKDIQQLFTACDRRIEALRRNLGTDEERDCSVGIEKTTPTTIPFDDDDKESFLDGPHSSPDSSPDCHVSSRARLAGPAVKTVGVASQGKDRNRSDVREKGREERVGSEEVKSSSGGVCDGEGMASDIDRESATTATPPSSRSPSLGASTTTTISSSDNNNNSNNNGNNGNNVADRNFSR